MNKMQEPEMGYSVPVLSWALVLVLHFPEADSLNRKPRMLHEDCVCAHSDTDFGQKGQA